MREDDWAVQFTAYVRRACGGERLESQWLRTRMSAREASMFENLHWSVQAIPIVVVGGVILTWLLGRHKEKKSSDHIFKI